MNTHCTLRAIKVLKGVESSLDDLLKKPDVSRSIITSVIYQELRQLATITAMSNTKWVMTYFFWAANNSKLTITNLNKSHFMIHLNTPLL